MTEPKKEYRKSYYNGDYVVRNYKPEDFDSFEIDKSNTVFMDTEKFKEHLATSETYVLLNNKTILCVFGILENYLYLVSSPAFKDLKHKMPLQNIATEELKRLKGDKELLFTVSPDNPHNEYILVNCGMKKSEEFQELDGVQQRVWYYK